MNYKLQQFAQNELILGRNDTEREKINSSLRQLEKVLKSKLDIIEIKRFGSYTRNTIIPRKYDSNSDIDILVIFSGEYTPETYRSRIIKALEKAYPNSISKKDFPVVKLELNHIMFDIVPCIKTINWNTTTYSIPNKGNSWMKTVPNDINDDISSKNKSSGNNRIREVIRLCKHWNASAGYPLSSYLMEKKITQQWYMGNDNTYEMFLKTLNSIAEDKTKITNIIKNIRQYEGNYYSAQDKEKQLYWLKQLLPKLK